MDTASLPCPASLENAFGPFVPSICLRGLDFTLLFEESILAILPMSIAIFSAIFRIIDLQRQSSKVHRSWKYRLKLAIFCVYIALQVSLLILWTARGHARTRTTLASLSITLLGSIVLTYLSYLEHMRSMRPSTILITYLGLSILCDSIHARTLLLMEFKSDIIAVFLTGLIIKILMFCFENIEKRALLLSHLQDASPEETGGILNRILFVWLNELFAKGFRGSLSVDALPSLDEEILDASKPRKLMYNWQKADKSSEHALLWTFAIHYKWKFLIGILPRLTITALNFAQPFLVEKVLHFTSVPWDSNSRYIAYSLIGAYATVYIGLALAFSLYEHQTDRLRTLFRGSLITMIYDKTLRLDSSSITDAESITLISADIDRIGESIYIVHEAYSSVVELVIALWLLYRLLGVAMVASTAYLVVGLVAGIPIARAAGDAQAPWLEAIEERLAVTAKVLVSMKSIKLTGLSQKVSHMIADLRTQEIRASYRHRLLSAVTGIIMWGFGVYILLARSNDTPSLNPGIAFAALTLFDILDNPLIYLVHGWEDIQTMVNSFRRIQKHLLSDEQQDPRIALSLQSSKATSLIDFQFESDHDPSQAFTQPDSHVPEDSTDYVARIHKLSSQYNSDSPSVFDGLNLDIMKGKTTMIYGPVGCGKSTLVKLLLGELLPSTGSISTTFLQAAYCPQSPWITWGTVQENILGMSLWDKPWYKTVTDACALSTDFKEFPNGDQMKTGTRGSRLSGGQQIRVAAEILTAKQSLARALYSRQEVMVLDDVLTGLDRKTEQFILDAVFGPSGLVKRLGSTVILTTNSAEQLRYADHVIILDEKGQVKQKGTIKALSASGGFLEHLDSLSMGVTSRNQLELTDETLQELGLPDEFEDGNQNRQEGDFSIYAYYASIAGWRYVLSYLFGCSVLVFGVTFPAIWLQWWTNANAANPNESILYWLGFYALWALFGVIGIALADITLDLFLVPGTAKSFHELLLDTTLRATTSFLTSTNAGTTINRFSQDLGLVDDDLPNSCDSVVYSFMSVVVSTFMVFLGSGYIAAAIPMCIAIIYAIQYFYLRTSRQLRYLDIEAKAPLFSHFLETLSGISCIRAYGWTDEYMERNHKVLDYSQKPYYLLYCLQRWLGLTLDLFVAGLAILLVSLATTVGSGSTGFLGVALFNIVLFGNYLQWLVKEWTQLETVLGAINRIRSYVFETACEDQEKEKDQVPENWPCDGAITFKSISASYQSSLEPVLRNVDLQVKPGEKTALCGRTGSGKSSLISTLLRMLELEDGSISIDGIDISSVPRQEIRSRLNTLPQEPFFLRGNVRENVDPLNLVDDERIISALRTVKIWDLLDARGGLDADLNDDSLSHGQRQLFCLARAIVKPSSILIMDEATSSVDSETDELIQRVIEEEFAGRTIIAIAHKLDLILDYDRVIMLDKGRVVDNGRPRELLQAAESPFRRLYESASNV